MMIVLCSRDQRFIDESVKTLGLDCSTCFESVDEVVKNISLDKDDILIFDLSSADSDDIAKVECKVVALCRVPVYEEAARLLKMGVKAYGNSLMLDINLKQAVETVRSGQIWLPPAILNNMIMSIPTGADVSESDDLSALSEREREVATLVGKGKSNKEIASEMDITVRTVKAHLSSIFMKLNCRDRVELALKIK